MDNNQKYACAEGAGREKNGEELRSLPSLAKTAVVYKDGKPISFGRTSDGFARIVAAWEKMTEGAVRMPAFGVSINRVTREGMRQGMWAEFVFARERALDGMPFDALLFEVAAEHRGFNLARRQGGGYDGRCFYLDLRGKTMADFAETLARLLSGGSGIA